MTFNKISIVSLGFKYVNNFNNHSFLLSMERQLSKLKYLSIISFKYILVVMGSSSSKSTVVFTSSGKNNKSEVKQNAQNQVGLHYIPNNISLLSYRPNKYFLLLCYYYLLDFTHFLCTIVETIDCAVFSRINK